MVVAVIITLIIIIIVLSIKLHKKVELDNTELLTIQAAIKNNKADLKNLEAKAQQLVTDIDNNKNQLTWINYNINQAQSQYDDLINNKTQQITTIMNAREVELEKQFNIKKELYEKTLEDIQKECDIEANNYKDAAAVLMEQYQADLDQLKNETAFSQERFNGIRKTLATYEKDRQSRLFATIQVPDEFHDDIEFLLTTVSAKVQHPDVINKLVWTEYIKPYLEETFKRIEIKPEPGIYKLTNLDSGKAYIGKSTDVKKRIADHFKSSVGMKSIADQAVHHEILKTGIWNWTIEVIIYCDKDKLSELEKYYIDFFKTQEFGYNRNAGG